MLEFYRADLGSEFHTSERCGIVELMNDVEFPDFSIARCRVEPGVKTQLHSLTETHEVYVVLQGSGMMGDGVSQPRQISVMDCVRIPAGHPQQVENTGKEDLIFLAVCAERFRDEVYVAHAQMCKE